MGFCVGTRWPWNDQSVVDARNPPSTELGMVAGRSRIPDRCSRGQKTPRTVWWHGPCRCFLRPASPRQKDQRAVSAAARWTTSNDCPASSGAIGSGPWSPARSWKQTDWPAGLLEAGGKAKVMIIHDGKRRTKRRLADQFTETLAGRRRMGGWVPQNAPLRRPQKPTRKRSKQLSEDGGLVQAQVPWPDGSSGGALAKAVLSAQWPATWNPGSGPSASRSRCDGPAGSLNRSARELVEPLCEGFPARLALNPGLVEAARLRHRPNWPFLKRPGWRR